MTKADSTALVERLRFLADAGDYGRKPDPTDSRRQAATLLESQAATIAELQGALDKCLDALADPVIGTTDHDDPEWYGKADRAIAIASAALTKSRSAG